MSYTTAQLVNDSLLAPLRVAFRLSPLRLH